MIHEIAHKLGLNSWISTRFAVTGEFRKNNWPSGGGVLFTGILQRCRNEQCEVKRIKPLVPGLQAVEIEARPALKIAA